MVSIGQQCIGGETIIARDFKTTKIYNLENIKRSRHLDDRTSAH